MLLAGGRDGGGGDPGGGATTGGLPGGGYPGAGGTALGGAPGAAGGEPGGVAMGGMGALTPGRLPLPLPGCSEGMQDPVSIATASTEKAAAPRSEKRSDLSTLGTK